ncbi:tRNA modification GTPase [Methylocucumis oryzae]|uniref:tRNA modification GTPase n=1 Tax=Methylocucumis oryzae TaxID=1632867 RepID=UPI003F6CC9A2
MVEQRLTRLLQQVTAIGQTAQQGRLLREGISLVLAGKPNTGKSSLLNALAGHDAAIVTDIPGTTRDVLRERIQIDGLPINIIDTAGLRDSQDVVEQEGIRRARLEINNADIVLFMQDVRLTPWMACSRATQEQLPSPELAEIEVLPERIKRIHVFNKIDLVGVAPSVLETATGAECYISVKTGAGVALLTEQIKKLVGFQTQASVFMARTRHLDALAQAQHHLEQALAQLKTHYAFELVAEELRIAQQHLGEITGQVSSDELLGKIFASFCIGK